MSYAPGAPPCIWALRIDPGTKLTLLCSWSRADHQDQQNPKPCTIWFPRRFYPADHAKAGKAMPPASARDLDVAERTGSTPSAVRKHFTKLRALGLADASGRCVELTPPSQDCPHRGTDCDDTTNPSVASTATTGAETATLGAKTATTGSAQLTPPVPPTPPNPAVEARDPHDLAAALEAAPTPPRKPSSNMVVSGKPRAPGHQAGEQSGVLDPPPVDPWAARVREASESAHYHLAMSDGPAPSYGGLLTQAVANYGAERVLLVLRAWEADLPERRPRPPANKLWWKSWTSWVERELGITAPKPEARETKRSPNGQAALDRVLAKVETRRLEVVS